MTKKRGRGHLKGAGRPAGAGLPERADLEGLPSAAVSVDATLYNWVYDADSRNLVHEYRWVSAENGVDIVYSPTGRRARLVDGAWILES